MFFLPFSILLFLLFLIALPLLFILLQVRIVGIALRKIGLSPKVAFIVMLLSLIGSGINIPLTIRDAVPREDNSITTLGWSDARYHPAPYNQNKQVIAINVGGGIIPLVLVLYVLRRAPIAKTIIATAISSFIMYLLAKPVPGLGVQIPIFIPPLVAVALGYLLSPRNPVPVAYTSGVLGVIIGADLMNLYNLTGGGVMSIGGAGVYDGIFLVGIISAFLA